MTRKARKKRLQKLNLHAFHQKRHTFRRFLERHNIDLSEYKYANLIWQIQNNKSQPVERKSYRVVDHLVMCEGKPFVVGYDKLTKQIRTVLPAITIEEVYAA
jgi:hypothetical protein